MATLMEDFELGNIFEESDFDLFSDNSYHENPMKSRSSVNDDPILTTLSHETNKFNVLDVVDPLLDLMDPHPSQICPDCAVLKRSPWHESDSGVSDTVSTFGSPEHCSSDNQTSSSLTNTNAHKLNMKSADGLDDELAAYLRGNDHEIRSPSSHSNGGSEDLSFFTHAFDEKSFVDVTSDDESFSLNKTLKNVHHNTSEDSKSVSRCGPSEVKILKVVRPSNSSAGVTSEDIAKAMEERSKKNAAQAKMNREKKKAYIQSLESEVEDLKSSNESLKSENEKMKQEMSEKDEEIDYLKSVLANSSALSGLLKNISDVKEVKLSATIMARKRASNGDHSYNLVENPPQKRARLIKENLKKAGVCLHVTEGTACLEFCAHCSKLAQKSHSYS